MLVTCAFLVGFDVNDALELSSWLAANMKIKFQKHKINFFSDFVLACAKL